jgi:hypothetical protein
VNDQLLIEVIHGGHDAILEFLFGCNASGAPELIRSGSRGRIRTTIGYELEAGALEKHAGPAFLATINDGLLGSCATGSTSFKRSKSNWQARAPNSRGRLYNRRALRGRRGQD